MDSGSVVVVKQSRAVCVYAYWARGVELKRTLPRREYRHRYYSSTQRLHTDTQKDTEYKLNKNRDGEEDDDTEDDNDETDEEEEEEEEEEYEENVDDQEA